MTRIGHLLDRSANWQQRVALSQILDRMPRDRYESFVATITGDSKQRLHGIGSEVEVLPAMGGVSFLASSGISRFATRKRISMIHAWGIPAAIAARAVSGVHLIVHLFDPREARQQARRLRSMARPSGFAIACSCESVRRRLVEGGVPMELTAVIRPAVDFAMINRFHRIGLRDRLGVSKSDRLVIIAEPLSRTGGQFEAAQNLAVAGHSDNGIRMILPGRSRERDRIWRFMDSFRSGEMVVVPQRLTPYEHLVAVSDILLITPRGDVPTTSVAWAMAAGTAVIGTAVQCITEMIAHQVNGLLCKKEKGRSLSAAINKLVADRASQEKVAETARGQAYEVFGLRRHTDQIMRLYDNVLSGRPAEHGIDDSAIER